MSENKKSKFEKKALELLDEFNDAKLANRAYRKAVSSVEVQIAQLNSKKVELEAKIEEAMDEVEMNQFSIVFNLPTYDNSCSKLEDLKDDLLDVEATIENRKDLLKSWK